MSLHDVHKAHNALATLRNSRQSVLTLVMATFDGEKLEKILESLAELEKLERYTEKKLIELYTTPDRLPLQHSGMAPDRINRYT